EQVLGSDAISTIAAKIGTSQSFTRTILGHAIPHAVAQLAKGGAIRAAFRALAAQFLASAAQRSSFPDEKETPREREQMRGGRMQDGRAVPVLDGLIIPCATVLIALGAVLGYFIGAGDRDLARPPPIAAQNALASPQQVSATPSLAPVGGANYTSPPVAVGGAIEAAITSSALSGGGGKTQAGTPKLPAPEFPAIYFATNRAQPVPASRPSVPKAAKLINQLPAGTVIEVAGYTDSVG